MQRVLYTASQRKAESQEFAKFTSSMERVFTGHSFKSQIVSTINFTSQGALLVQKKPLLEKKLINITEGREDKQKRLSEANRLKGSITIAIYTKTYPYIKIYLYILSLHLLSHCLVRNAIYSSEVEPFYFIPAKDVLCICSHVARYFSHCYVVFASKLHNSLCFGQCFT